MELSRYHIIIAGILTATLCAVTWSVAVNKSFSWRASKQAVRQEASASNWHPKPEDAEKLLSEIAAPDESEPVAAAQPVQPPRDWTQIKASGRLRVALMPRQGPDGISGSMTPEDFERALLAGFARKHGLGLEQIVVRHFDELQQALLSGRCDTIAASYAITPERSKIFAFSKPFRRTVEQIAVSASDKAKSLQDLDGRTGVIQPGTCYMDSMKALAASRRALKCTAAPDGLDPETLFSRVASGLYAYTIAEDSYIASHMEKRKDLKTVYSFPEARAIAWPLRREAPVLRALLDSYIEESLAGRQASVPQGDDLKDIKKRGFLRVITRNNPYCYFIHRGRAMGFEYELAAEFAKEQGLVPVMIVPPEWDDMREWLLQGKGDIIAANLSATPERLADRQLALAGRYGSSCQMLAGRISEKPFASVKSLKGRSVCARRSSSYWDTLTTLRNAGIDFKIDPASEDLETCEILSKVASGECDLAVVDDSILNAEVAAGRKVKELFQLSPEMNFSWAMRSNAPELQSSVEEFLSRQSRPTGYRSAFFNITYRKYYQNRANVVAASKEMALDSSSLVISPYDQLFKRYAARYGFNWCVIAAQAYQESQFDPNVVSYLGTQGLMQVLPSTAADLGFKNLRDPETGIHAGVRFLKMQMERLASPKVSEIDLVCFALASYNAGYGHVLDARLLAEEMGLNPDVWFGNVEEGLKRLSTPKGAARAKYGYCKSAETVAYVRDIMARYKHYAEMVEMKSR